MFPNKKIKTQHDSSQEATQYINLFQESDRLQIQEVNHLQAIDYYKEATRVIEIRKFYSNHKELLKDYHHANEPVKNKLGNMTKEACILLRIEIMKTRHAFINANQNNDVFTKEKTAKKFVKSVNNLHNELIINRLPFCSKQDFYDKKHAQQYGHIPQDYNNCARLLKVENFYNKNKGLCGYLFNVDARSEKKLTSTQLDIYSKIKKEYRQELENFIAVENSKEVKKDDGTLLTNAEAAKILAVKAHKLQIYRSQHDFEYASIVDYYDKNHAQQYGLAPQAQEQSKDKDQDIKKIFQARATKRINFN